MSKWHAVDAVEDAIEATKNLLFTPVRYSFWLKLALVVYLLGSGGLNLRVNQDWQSMDDMVKDITFDSQTIFLIAAMVGLVLLIMLALTYISSVMRFVYIRSLVEGEIRLKEYFSKDAEKGLKLFYLNLLIFLLNIILVLAVVATALYTVGATDDKADFVVFLLLFAILISAIVWIITQALFMWVVNDFTVPVMYAKDLGIVESIKYTLKLIKENIWQFVIYLLVSLAAGIVAAIASIIVLILVLVVFVVVGVLFAVVLLVPFIALGIDPTNISPAILWTLISAALVIFIAAAILFGYATTVILLPIHVFMRYLSLIFLGRTDTTLDLFKNKKKIKPKKKIGMKKVKKEIKVY